MNPPAARHRRRFDIPRRAPWADMLAARERCFREALATGALKAGLSLPDAQRLVGEQMKALEDQLVQLGLRAARTERVAA